MLGYSFCRATLDVGAMVKKLKKPYLITAESSVYCFSGCDGKVARIVLQKTFGMLKASGFRVYCSMEWGGGGNPYEWHS